MRSGFGEAGSAPGGRSEAQVSPITDPPQVNPIAAGLFPRMIIDYSSLVTTS